MLAAGGLLAFTAETHDGDGVIIGEGLRYAHSAAYVRACGRQPPGSNWSRCEDLSARNEDNVPVPGLVVVAARPHRQVRLPPNLRPDAAISVTRKCRQPRRRHCVAMRPVRYCRTSRNVDHARIQGENEQ